MRARLADTFEHVLSCTQNHSNSLSRPHRLRADTGVSALFSLQTNYIPRYHFVLHAHSSLPGLSGVLRHPRIYILESLLCGLPSWNSVTHKTVL